MNLLDDSLPSALVNAGHVDDALMARFSALVSYARQCGAQGVLFTCSAFGPAIEAAGATAGIPVLKPNEAMFEDALDACARLGRAARIGMVSTFAASVPSMRDELLRAAQDRGLQVSLEVECPQGAMDALGHGDAPTHDALVTAAASTLAGCDVLMLGQFSMAHLRETLATTLCLPVLSSPDSAVRMLQRALA